jgi:hypothetical protein
MYKHVPFIQEKGRVELNADKTITLGMLCTNDRS